MDATINSTEGPALSGTAYLDSLNFYEKSGALGALEKLRVENRLLDTLLNDAAKIYAMRSIDDILAFIVDRMLEQFIPLRFLFVVEPRRGSDLIQYSYAQLKPSEDRLSKEAYDAVVERVGSSRFPIAYERFSLPEPAKGELERFSPAIILPLAGIEGAFGFAVIGHKALGGAYTDVEWMYIDKLSRFIAIVVQSTLFRESAITDAKTGLYNHAYFMQRVGQEIAHVVRHKATAGLIMIDVDHFKRFNDTWGHLAGDEVLVSLAQALKRAIRAEDVAARFGGEEFCILAIQCDRRSLMEVAERIRLAIAEMVVRFKGDELSVTASLGCCVIGSEREETPECYVERADRALYRSKREGRNRTTICLPGLLDRASLLHGG